MLVLGIDPGTAICGYGLVESAAGKEKLVAYGSLQTTAAMPMPERLASIGRGFQELLATYHPQAVAVEELFYFKNAKTVISVAQSRGVILYEAANQGLEIGEYTPLQVKQAVVGYGGAEKKQVQIMVAKILGMKDIPKPDDAADGLAIAICHLHMRQRNIMYGGVKG
jgi:crossover junction endodeoxyribonuclease RuvC